MLLAIMGFIFGLSTFTQMLVLKKKMVILEKELEKIKGAE
jgi:hypothetical protein